MVRAPNELRNLEAIIISSVFRRHLIIYIHMNNSPPKKEEGSCPNSFKIT
jgi:hypothetical protein